MKKLLFILVLISLVGLFACNDSEPAEAPAPVADAPAAEDARPMAFSDRAEPPAPSCPCETGEALLKFQASPNAPVQSWCVKIGSKRYEKLVSQGADICCRANGEITCPNECFPLYCGQGAPTP